MLLIKAMVCDVDGTITDASKRIQVVGIAALRRMQERGYPVIIASGNVLPVAFGLSAFIGLKAPVVAENGGLVSYQEKIYQLQSREVPERAFAHLKQRMPEVERLFTDNWRETEVALKRSTDEQKVRDILKDEGVDIEATGFAIHIMELGHNKMRGVKKACELVGIGIENVAAFGDSDNDTGMLSGCGVGIAVGNASEKAKRAADYVCKADSSEGVVEGLEYLGLL